MLMPGMVLTNQNVKRYLDFAGRGLSGTAPYAINFGMFGVNGHYSAEAIAGGKVVADDANHVYYQSTSTDFAKFRVGQRVSATGTNEVTDLVITSIERASTEVTNYPYRITLDLNGATGFTTAADTQAITISGPKPENADETSNVNDAMFKLHNDSVIVSPPVYPARTANSLEDAIIQFQMPSNAVTRGGTSANGKTYSQLGIFNGASTDLANAILLATLNTDGYVKSVGAPMEFKITYTAP